MVGVSYIPRKVADIAFAEDEKTLLFLTDAITTQKVSIIKQLHSMCRVELPYERVMLYIQILSDMYTQIEKYSPVDL